MENPDVKHTNQHSFPSVKCIHQNSSTIFYTLEHIHQNTFSQQSDSIQSTIRNSFQKATTSTSALYTASPGPPHKRAVANLRERKRMRLINHAFDGLQSHLPKELLYSNGLFNSMNSRICNSFLYEKQRFIVELINKQVDGQLIKATKNPINSHLHRQTVSKVDVLRAAINYIQILEKILDELKAEHCSETWNTDAYQRSSLKLKCKQSQADTHPVSCFCSIRHSQEQFMNEYHKQLLSGTVIKTGTFYSQKWKINDSSEIESL
ncbi:unnamed protein product [Schistosoma turkestanicum]|nr:unnamed protein product [Schistosoma turkestanicum]